MRCWLGRGRWGRSRGRPRAAGQREGRSSGLAGARRLGCQSLCNSGSHTSSTAQLERARTRATGVTGEARCWWLRAIDTSERRDWRACAGVQADQPERAIGAIEPPGPDAAPRLIPPRRLAQASARRGGRPGAAALCGPGNFWQHARHPCQPGTPDVRPGEAGHSAPSYRLGAGVSESLQRQ